MILSKKQLFSLTAITLKGVRIGRVIDIGLDNVSQNIVTYHVRPFWQWRKSLKVGIIASSPLLIQRTQVVRVTETELIVDDATVAQLQQAVEYLPVARAPVV